MEAAAVAAGGQVHSLAAVVGLLLATRDNTVRAEVHSAAAAAVREKDEGYRDVL